LPGVKALIDGLKLTERELLKALEKNGVRQRTCTSLGLDHLCRE